jgi:hypothetical protein
MNEIGGEIDKVVYCSKEGEEKYKKFYLLWCWLQLDERQWKIGNKQVCPQKYNIYLKYFLAEICVNCDVIKMCKTYLENK